MKLNSAFSWPSSLICTGLDFIYSTSGDVASNEQSLISNGEESILCAHLPLLMVFKTPCSRMLEVDTTPTADVMVTGSTSLFVLCFLLLAAVLSIAPCRNDSSENEIVAHHDRF